MGSCLSLQQIRLLAGQTPREAKLGKKCNIVQHISYQKFSSHYRQSGEDVILRHIPSSSSVVQHGVFIDLAVLSFDELLCEFRGVKGVPPKDTSKS